MVIVKMGNCIYDEQKKTFEAGYDTDAQFMRDMIIGEANEHTTIVSADVVHQKKWKA